MSEAEFRQFNCLRLAILKALVQEIERAGEACDIWLASGHIADYRIWQRHLRQVQEADAEYQRIRREMADGGFWPSPR
jgi:hypothetical protein